MTRHPRASFTTNVKSLATSELTHRDQGYVACQITAASDLARNMQAYLRVGASYECAFACCRVCSISWVTTK